METGYWIYTDRLDENKSIPEGYNIKEKFDFYNKTLFDNSIPNIPLSFKRMKGFGGVFKAKVRRYKNGVVEYVDNSGSIVLSTNYVRNEEQYDGILIHEMIHAWMAIVEKDPSEHHGPKFMRKLRELNKKTLFNIPKTEKVSELELSPDVPIRDVIVVVSKLGSNWAYALVNPSSYWKEEHAIKLFLQRYPETTIYLTHDQYWSDMAMRNKLQRPKVVRGYIKLGFYRFTDSAEEVIKNLQMTAKEI